jgi:GH15 family glucan-1,4-alpha-glucosidase
MIFQPIENYGVIGNMCSAALVGVQGAIEFFCFPRFDSPTIFASLLDPGIGGSFTLNTAEQMEHKQMYLPDTNVLLTRMLCHDSSAELTDFMPVTENTQHNVIVRKVRCMQGTVHFTMRCQPSFDYARAGHEIAEEERTITFAQKGGKQGTIRLRSTVPIKCDGPAAIAEFTLERGETAYFVLGGEDDLGREEWGAKAIEKELGETIEYWRRWAGKSQYKGRWREAVSRSALLLKLLTSRQFGTLIAAPTFGLPEHLGGERNWDYRYTWLRDAAFTLYAFMRLGYREEADNFWMWLRDRLSDGSCNQAPMQLMYGIDGTPELEEQQLDHLSGYEHSNPVRIGNGAYSQLQLDIYGEVFDAMYLYSKYGHAIPHDGWNNVKRILQWLGQNWNQADEGIWEIRSGQKHLLHSRLMCWVAFDRAIRLAHKRSLSAPLIEWYQHRDAIVDDIYQNFWSDELQSFVQSRGSQVVDASVLLMPLMRFVSPIDPKWLSTLARVEKELLEDAFVYRYRNGDTEDGLSGEEGSFTCCSFWMVECLARAGQHERAQVIFEKLLAHGNHVGLFAEEIGRNGRQLGNFPQALTHLALISAATYLDRAMSKQEPKAWE